MKTRWLRLSSLLAGIVVVLGCTDSKDENGAGGSSGGGAAGTAAGSGGSVGGTGGTGGNTGGTAGSTGGTGGSGTGGSLGGSGGSAGTGGNGAQGGSSSGGDGAQGGSSAGGSGGASGSGGDAGSGGSGTDIPGGGTVLFEEHFDDADFTSRDWYDGAEGTINSTEHIDGSTSSFECAFSATGTSCSGGKPARHKFTGSESVYFSFHIKFSENWVGSGKAYHPHMFHFLTDLDDDFVGPAHTHLTTYMEVVEKRAMIALQDAANVDLGCVLKNDDSFEGCDGNFDTYPFTEDRSVCSCNGLLGDLDGRDCYSNGDGTFYSSRSWRSAGEAFGDQPGPRFKGDWHFVEVYFEMNGIEAGKGVANGKIRWVQDGEVLVSSDNILMRTASHAAAQFTQFAMLPYIGDGSPSEQHFYIDDLVVATARP